MLPLIRSSTSKVLTRIAGIPSIEPAQNKTLQGHVGVPPDENEGKAFQQQILRGAWSDKPRDGLRHSPVSVLGIDSQLDVHMPSTWNSKKGRLTMIWQGTEGTQPEYPCLGFFLTNEETTTKGQKVEGGNLESLPITKQLPLLIPSSTYLHSAEISPSEWLVLCTRLNSQSPWDPEYHCVLSSPP